MECCNAAAVALTVAQSPFGSAIVRNGEVVAVTHNTVWRDSDPSAHAEVNCIRAAARALKTISLHGCTLYSTTEPCPMCLGAIYWAHLARVYFGNVAAEASAIGFDDSFIYREFEQPFPRRSIPMIQMMHQQARAAFQTWKEKPNKVPY